MPYLVPSTFITIPSWTRDIGWTNNFIYRLCYCHFKQSGATVEETTGEHGNKDT